MPRFITIKEAASETGLSYKFLRQLYLSKKIKGIRSGTKILLNADNLSETLERLSEGGEQ